MNRTQQKKRRSRKDRSNLSTGNVPPRNYLSTHIAAAKQSERLTLEFAYANVFNAASTAYTEPFCGVVNSPYDPDNNVGGASCTGFAKLMAFYSKCFVRGARIRVIVAQYNTLSDSNVATGITITTNNSYVNWPYAITTGLCKYGMLSQHPDKIEFEMSVDISKFLDKPNILDDPQLFCTSGANPGQLVCCHFWTYVLGSATVQMSYIIRIEFDCVFTDPIPFT